MVIDTRFYDTPERCPGPDFKARNASVRPMRVCIANSEIGWGGLGRFTMSLAQVLKQQGFEVHGVLTHGRGERGEEYAALLDSCHCMSGSSTVRRYLSTARTIHKMRPDILLINYLGTVHYLLPWIRHSRVISVIHSDQEDFYRIASIYADRVHAWVAPSTRVKEGFCRRTHGEYDDRVFVIAHGVDVHPEIRTTSPHGALRLAFIGALYHHKGVDLLPAILRTLQKRRIPVRLSVLGGGELSDWLRGELCEEIRNGVVRIPGVVEHSEVQQELAHSDILLFPTRVEAFGLVIAEAMAKGVVPVVSHLPGITDTIVEHGKTGFLVDKDNVNGFVDQVEWLHDHRAILMHMREAAVTAAQERFSLDVMGLAYVRLIHSLVEKA
jgi:glycosyltransferase involved in cell wall biosynthesis